jgi:hypothetical protein
MCEAIRSASFIRAEINAMKIPNARNVCLADKTTQRATDALKTWGDVSPWRH